MRLLSSATAVLTLTAFAVVAPAVQAGAKPRPVKPTVHQLAIPGAPVPAQTAAPAPRLANGKRVVANLRHAKSEHFDVMGVTFSGSAPKGLVIEARVHQDGAWSDWQELAVGEGGPDRNTAEAKQARIGTEPLAAIDSDGVEVRVSTDDGSAPKDLSARLVDAGTSPHDAVIGQKPAGAAQAAVAQPVMLSREEWGADERLRTCEPDVSTNTKGATIHHTVNSNTYSAAETPALVRGIYAYHTQSQKWCDIGYNFIVDRFGRIFEGRYGGVGRNMIGAHTGGFNSQLVGISSLGTHSASGVSSTVLNSISRLVAWKASNNGWDPSTTASFTSAGNPGYPAGQVINRSRVEGHRGFYPTECPGDSLYAQLSSVRSSAHSTYVAGQANTSWTPQAAVTKVETFNRPAGTTISLAGHGYGHGRGMSQWGAYGAATKGLDWRKIVGFYYPGTSGYYQGNPTTRVELTVLGSGGTTVVSKAGLKISDGTTTSALSTGPAQWRVIPEGGGLTLQWRTATGWASSGYWRAWTRSALDFSNNSTGMVRTVLPSGAQREYRHTVRTMAWGTAAKSISVISTELYLWSVVPSEMPALWKPAAVQSQAVAARTYAAYGRAHPRSAYFDTCDTTACQVYKGRADYNSAGTLTATTEHPSSNAAVGATAGWILRYAGAAAFTEFSAANGGRTAAGSFPYLPVKADPYDNVVSGSPSNWSVNIPITTLEAAFREVGVFRSLEIHGRTGGGDWGGRTTSVRTVGATGATTLSGEAFRTRLGLRSTWWAMSSSPATSTASFPKDLTSDGIADLMALSSDGKLRVFKGSGQMGYTTITAGTGWGTARLLAAVGTWDSDNRGDVLATWGDGSLWFYRGGDTGVLDQPEKRIGSGWGGINHIVPTGDFSGDGKTDFLARDNSGYLRLYRGNGAGGFGTISTVGAGWNIWSKLFSTGDFTGDGKADLLAVHGNGMLFLYNGTGTGSVSSARQISGIDFRGYSAMWGVGDVTGDQRGDIMARRSSDGALVVYPGNGRSGFGSPITIGTAWAAYTRWAQ